MSITRETAYDKISFARGTEQEILDNIGKLAPYEPAISQDTDKVIFKTDDGSIKSFGIGADGRDVFVKKDGDTMTGKLVIPDLEVGLEPGVGVRVGATRHKALVGVSSSSGEYLFGGNPDGGNTFINYLRVGSNKFEYHSGSSDYQIYHKGNKPTASDVGAVSKSGDTIAGSLKIDESITVGGRTMLSAKSFGGGMGQVPAISLAIGDTDTGFNWASDGNLEAWANNVKLWNLRDVYHNGRKPTASDVGLSNVGNYSSVNKSGDTMTGPLKFVVPGQAEIGAGSGDGASSTVTNLKISSWFGIGFANLTNGQPVPYGENAVWMNVRNGDMGIRGSFVSSGNITAYSDERLKYNIEDIPEALDKINSLRGVTYNRKDLTDKPKHTGLIAQEVKAVLPEAVQEDKDGILSVAYGNMVGLLVEGIKELSKKNEILMKKILKLEEVRNVE